MNIIVTGTSRGIGYALVKKLVQSGNHRVVAIARDAGKLQLLRNDCLLLNEKSEVFPISFDLASPAYSFKLLPGILEHFDNIDILINNAGTLIKKEFSELSDEDFETVFNLNVKSVFKLTRALLPYFNRPAHIVNIGSMGGIQGSSKFPGLSLYSASKGAVAVLTEAMAEEFKEKQIRVNCLAYGAVQTEMLAEAFPGYKAPLLPDDMAAFVSDFALNGHHFFNGKILPVSLSTP
jgi:NAD(P)-dependent dehydrogenase (short-subunit alcohol dehydrogenase family)